MFSFKKILHKKTVIYLLVIVLAVAIKTVSFFPALVEAYYTYGIYPGIAKALRFLFGWIPFSLGDILYMVLFFYIMYYLFKFLKKIYYRQINKRGAITFLKYCIKIILLVFVLFYGLWGLNYSRTGIASQLQLQEEKYTVQDVDTLAGLLHKKLNVYAALLTPAMRDSFIKKRDLFADANAVYTIAEKYYPFLAYEPASIKPSLFSYLGNYMGFQGYYNPFTGEAQVNTTVPQSVEPFVATHEIAHQLGYAKESEANFVGFLACRLHPSINFKYSVYFDMYHYAISELKGMDSASAHTYDSTLHAQVIKDREEYIEFYKKYRNPIEPYIGRFYDYFLKANNQPNGKKSYNEVIIWLIAYYKKYGKEKI